MALVLAPTRELARQVEKEFGESAPILDTICVYGGVSISSQMNTLDYGVDVVVGTPGRIIDLLKRGALNLSEVQFVVLDEADQMLAVGFDEDVEIILDKLPKKRQSMMFSATMPSWIRKLTQKYLKDPLTIDLVSMHIHVSFIFPDEFSYPLSLVKYFTLYEIAQYRLGWVQIMFEGILFEIFSPLKVFVLVLDGTFFRRRLFTVIYICKWSYLRKFIFVCTNLHCDA